MSASITKLDYYCDKEQFYHLLTSESTYHFNKSWLTNLANSTALLMEQLPEVNWVGFYLWDGTQLILGPFQGKPACLEIQFGRGVCGIAAQRKEPVLVSDVSQFVGHIACDSASRSEVVIPLLGHGGELLGVLDVDSPVLNRFSWTDVSGLQKFTQNLVAQSDWLNFRFF